MDKSTKYHMKTPEDYEEGSGTPPTYKQLGVAYVASSTTHGVPHSFLARGSCKRILWIVLLIAGIGAFIFNLTLLVSKYVQFLPSTRINIYNNRSLPFPAVTICNTNPIKGSAVTQNARLVALLESWGVIQVTGNTTRRKRSLDLQNDLDLESDNYAFNKNSPDRAKRSSGEECGFVKVYNISEGMSTLCVPSVPLSNTTEEGCLQAACDHVTGGADQYNAINFRDGISCTLRSCERPFNDSTLLLSAANGGRDIYFLAFNECLSDPCVHGECLDTDLYYSCTCEAGYTGFNCDSDIDECESSPCQNGGTCQDLHNAYNCTCVAGYEAVDCSLVTSGYNEYTNTSCDGEDLLPAASHNVSECESLCDDTIGCIAFSYTTASSLCAIRAQCLTLTEQDGVSAFVKYVPSKGYSGYVDGDCPGSDLKPATTRTSAWDCGRECDEVVRCVAFVYIESIEQCHIKSSCDTSALTDKDPSGGYKVYLKTGRAAECSFPRARIPCPGSFTNMTEQQCEALPASCCYDNSQANVASCYLDTLFDLYHSHIHTVFRAAQKAPGSPVLYDLWVGDTFTPDLESKVNTSYLSVEDSETEVFKSVLVECAWSSAITAYVTAYSDGEEKIYFQFSVDNQGKSSWFSSSSLTKSSYSDASSSATYNYFSIDGNAYSPADVRRRWHINQSYGGCTFDTGWFVVLDVDHTGSCPWDIHTDYPLFMHSDLTTVGRSNNFLEAETFFIKIKLDDYYLGGAIGSGCVSSCLYLTDGSYQSCLGCNVYVVCTSEVLTYHVCHKEQLFDAYSRICQDDSYTCTGGRATSSCFPDNECDTNTQCLNGGSCNLVSRGWECLCESGYIDRYCQTCADFISGTNLYGTSQSILSWTVDTSGTVYADGVELDSISSWTDVVQSNVPCGTLMVAFSLEHSGGDYGLLASYDSAWASGDSTLKCTSNSGLVTADWNMYAYDDSGWEAPDIIAEHGDSPWGTLNYISSSAKWVWTTDSATQIYCRLQMCDDVDEFHILADDEVEVFADGISIHSSSYSAGTATVPVPCDTNQLALKLSGGSSDAGLLMQYSNEWLSGDEGSLVCTSDASVASSEDWMYSGYDTSSWDFPVVVSHSVPPPSELEDAQWVWTDDGASAIYCVIQIVPPTTTTSTTTVGPSTTEPFIFNSIYPERNENPPTEEFLREEDMMTLLASLDEDTKRKLGYSLNDLVTECNFGGQPCSQSDFSWFFDAVYGNCYMFNAHWNDDDNSTDFDSKEQGDRNGLTVILDIGQYEYIQDVGEAAGAVVVVHDSDDMPFPEDEGILAVPGKLTSVGIRKVVIHRLPEPHGDCEENLERNQSRSLFEDHYPVKYSVNSCFKTCYQQYVVQECGCGDPQYPIEGKVFGGQDIIPCHARNMTQDDCKYAVTKMYINDELDCDCPNPCQDGTYEYKVSSADWPSQVEQASVYDSLRNKLTTAGVTGLSDAQLKRNLVKIQVFYNTFSYKRLLEYPSYRLAKLFWDIGGILGLWLGCSVLSLVELLELGLDALVLLCYKCTKRQYWARPVKSKKPNDTTGGFDDLSKDRSAPDNLGGHRTNKKVKLSNDGKVLYSYSGQTGPGMKCTTPRDIKLQEQTSQGKFKVPGYLLSDNGL